MILEGPERARPIRRSVRIPCQVVRERDFRLVGRRTLDVSESGMRVAADRPVLTGEIVIVSFGVPLSPIWFDAEAVVTRVDHGRRAREHGRSLGLTFTYAGARELEAMRRQLGWFRAEAGSPPRPGHQRR